LKESEETSGLQQTSQLNKCFTALLFELRRLKCSFALVTKTIFRKILQN